AQRFLRVREGCRISPIYRTTAILVPPLHMRIRLFHFLLLRRGAVIVSAYFACHACALLASVLLILGGFGIETVGSPALWISLGVYALAMVALPRLSLHSLTMFHTYRSGLLHKATGNWAAAEA